MVKASCKGRKAAGITVYSMGTRHRQLIPTDVSKGRMVYHFPPHPSVTDSTPSSKTGWKYMQGIARRGMAHKTTGETYIRKMMVYMVCLHATP